MPTAHVNEMGIVFRKFNSFEQPTPWWDALLDELKAHHVPGLQQTGKRMSVDAGAPEDVFAAWSISHRTQSVWTKPLRS